MSAPVQPTHGPYQPQVALLGGLPTKSVDGPVLAILLAIFITLAAIHMTILQINQRRKKLFVMSGMLFGFCMARIVACTMRLVWMTHPTNVNVAIAAQVFVVAGVLLLFIINLIFVQRVIRGRHPEFAWAKWFSIAFKLYYVVIVLTLAALITCTVQSFFTLKKNIHRIDRDVQLYGSTFFAVTAFLPNILLGICFFIPTKTHVEKFGEGRFRTKVRILIFSSTLLTLGAAFRAGIAYVPRPKTNPAWYDSKACFYIFNFTIEIIIVSLYAYIRVDKRFIVPNASHGPGDYLRESRNTEPPQKETLADRVLDEEQVFGDDVAPKTARSDDVEAGHKTDPVAHSVPSS